MCVYISSDISSKMYPYKLPNFQSIDQLILRELRKNKVAVCNFYLNFVLHFIYARYIHIILIFSAFNQNTLAT